MDHFLTGFADEIIKVARKTPPVEKKPILTPEMKRRLKGFGGTAAMTAALHAVLSGKNATLGDSARAGIGWGGGLHAGRAAARASGFGSRGKLISGLVGGALGYKALQKKSPDLRLKPQAGMATTGGLEAAKKRLLSGPKKPTMPAVPPPHQNQADHRR